MPAGNSEVMQSVMGRAPDVTPLAPEPGDIWADLGFLKQPQQPETQQVRPLAEGQQVRLPQAIAPAVVPPPPAIPSHTVDSSPKSFFVQLTAANSEVSARAQWDHLRRQMPDLLEARVPSVVAAQVDGHQIWRLRTGGFATRADATAFCELLQSRRSSCWVVAGNA